MSNRLRSTALVRQRPRREPVVPATRPRMSGIPARVKTVGSFVPKLTEKAFSKYGFSAVALISEWPRIIGPALSAHTSPERLKWPRPIGKYTDLEDSCEGRPGATLVLRVDPAKALDVQYGQTQIIERINGYFGYRAIEKLRIIQAPIRRQTDASTSNAPGLLTPSLHTLSETTLPKPPNAPPTAPTAEATPPTTIKDSGLQAALERLQHAVTSTKLQKT